MAISSRCPSSGILYLLVASSGFAALSWEVIWQVKSTLALGISAWGTAVTLAVVMGGMGLGGLLMGNFLRNDPPLKAVYLYGLLEIVAGCAGLFLNIAFHALEKLDTLAYGTMPGSITLVFLVGMIVVFGIPALCMGATLPVFGLISRQFQVSVAKLYSLNTLGAAVGVLMVAFMLIPFFGMTHTIWIIAAINILIGFSTLLLAPTEQASALTPQPVAQIAAPPISFNKILFIVFVTGFATFTLEIAWFRSFADLFPNTTDVFAIMLACMLIALGLAAKNTSLAKQKKKLLGTQICLAGILILLVTPVIERLDNYFVFYKHLQIAASKIANNPATANFVSRANFNSLINPDTFTLKWTVAFNYLYRTLFEFVVMYLIIVPPVRLLGMAFPWLLEQQRSSRAIGNMYAMNTLAAIVGAISAAWILLPVIGFAKTAWIAGVLVMTAGVMITPARKRLFWAALGIIALLIAMFYETGIGKVRVEGNYATDDQGKPAKVLGFFEGPDATTSAVEYNNGTRALLINSVLAASESGKTRQTNIHYMAWMGHLPMLLHADPKNALVICFGTGQTANAVRNENPQMLDIVDVNRNVFKLAHYFRANENVLDDPRVKTIVMDGRAYLRRTQKSFDVITLEPMPPNSAGVNALYSKEFYELARQRLTANGIIAQWLPFHVAAPTYSASIAKTFKAVFPNAILWIDPDSKTGILLGSKDDNVTLASSWPGFARTAIQRDLTPEQIQQDVALNSQQLAQYSQYGKVINDDNQLLAYGKALYASSLQEQNFELLHRINNNIALLY
jgi:spermidine synthase